jgi:branched-chain amino acid transport system permease protein
VTEFLQYVIDGLGNGTLYALLAIGFTLVFGVMGIMNVAHADIYMLAAFAFYLVCDRSTGLGLPVAVGILTAIAGAALFAWLLFQLVLKRLDKDNVLALFVATLGVSFFLENLVSKMSDGQVRAVPAILPARTYLIGGLRIGQALIVELLVAAVLTTALLVFLRRAEAGRSMRAVAENPALAESVGIDRHRITLLAVVIASVVAAIGGLLNASVTSSADPFVANDVSLRMFAVAVVAGIGSVGGACLVGILLGVAEALTLYAGVHLGFDGSAWESIIGLLMMCVVLLTRPRGIFGRVQRIG